MRNPDSSARTTDAEPTPAFARAAPGAGPGHPLPSGEFPFATQLDVVRRFMAASRNGTVPVAPASVEGAGLPAGAAQANAAFLADSGLLVEERPGQFKPTPVAMQLVNTLLADEGRGRRLLRSIVEKTWFGRAAKALVGTRDAASVTEADLANALAAAAGIPEAEHRASLLLLVAYLSYTGILSRPPGIPSRPPGAPPVETPRTDRESPPPGSTGPSSRARAAEVSPPKREEPEWEMVQTSEFSLKILPTASALQRLRRQLDLLEERLRETGRAKRRR